MTASLSRCLFLAWEGSEFPALLVCACGNQGCWALLKIGSAAPPSPQLCLKSRRNFRPPSAGQSVSDRKPSAFHVPPGAGKSTKGKMVKVSCTDQQHKIPENRNWKYFQFIHQSCSLCPTDPHDKKTIGHIFYIGHIFNIFYLY